MRFTLAQIQDIIRANVTGQISSHLEINNISIDSRSISFPKSTLFIALKGNRVDGHAFIPALYSAGVRAFLVSETFDQADYPDAVFFQVWDVVAAMQQLAIYHRDQFDLPVIGITGSNGKTTIKEWLYQLLNPDHHLVKSPKSYNSQIGVALSVYNTTNEHTLGIFEGGISTVGEMQKIAPMIDCTIGIFTNIGSAHDEGFESRLDKVHEKLLLFTNSKKIICSADNEMVHSAVKENFPTKIISWSLHDKDADLVGKYISGSLHVSFDGKFGKITLPFRDTASVENLMHCITAMLHLGYDIDTVNERLIWLKRLALRLELVNGINGNLIINDCYNADIESLMIALDFMDQYAIGKSKTLVISDMHQISADTEQLYARIAGMITSKEISKVILIGKDIVAMSQMLPKDIKYGSYADTQSFMEDIRSWKFEDEIILVKGARKYELEQVCNRLQSQTHAAQLEVDISALLYNLSKYQGLLPTGTKSLVMVKASAYGGGSTEISTLLQYHNIDYIGVAYADEGVALRKDGIDLPILVLNPDWNHLDVHQEYDLEPEVYSIQGLLAVRQFEIANQVKLPIHIKFDTGMNRLGFGEKDLSDLIAHLKEYTYQVNTAFSHLSACDDPAKDDFTQAQFDKFDRFYSAICEVLDHRPDRHILNSVGILRHSKHSHEMVRLGKGIYGIDLPEAFLSQFERVHTLKATISQIKPVYPGMTIGYNAKKELTEQRQVATVNIGYADGVFRTAGNGQCQFWVKGQLAPTIGNICMDMFMLDVTGLSNVEVGDVVEIYGKNLPLETVAEQMGTVPLELLCGISSRVRRLYFQS